MRDRVATSAGPRLTRSSFAFPCGRGLYQELLVWETVEQTMSGEAEREFARIWRPIPKVVFSPDAEFGDRHGAAGRRRHRHRGRPAP